jgi:bacteriorhodopsin
MKYHHQNSISLRLRRWRRAHRFLWSFLALALLLLAIFVVIILLNKPEPAKQTEDKHSFYEGIPKKTIDNEYFTFTSELDWQFIDKESTATKFVYRSQRSQLLEHELVVFINT